MKNLLPFTIGVLLEEHDSMLNLFQNAFNVRLLRQSHNVTWSIVKSMYAQDIKCFLRILHIKMDKQ